MTDHLDTLSGTPAMSRAWGTQPGSDKPQWIPVHLLGRITFHTLGHEFPLEVTYCLGDGRGAAITEPVSGYRVWPITLEDLQHAAFDPVVAGQAALQKAIQKHGALVIAEAILRKQKEYRP